MAPWCHEWKHIVPGVSIKQQELSDCYMLSVTNVSNTTEAKQACTGIDSHTSLTRSDFSVQELVQPHKWVLCPMSIIRGPVDEVWTCHQKT